MAVRFPGRFYNRVSCLFDIKNKLDDRIKWLNAHTDEYLRLLKEIDEQEELEEMPENLTREVIEGKLKEAQERLARYEAY